MPELIIAEICPAPECNLTACEIEQMVDELALYHARFGDAFGRADQMRQSHIYLQGLLGDLARKTTERIAFNVATTPPIDHTAKPNSDTLLL